MRIMIATDKGGLKDKVAYFFASAPTFTVVEIEHDEIHHCHVVRNRYPKMTPWNIVQETHQIKRLGAQVVIAGHFGKDYVVELLMQGIEAFAVCGMTVEDAVGCFLRGELAPLETVTPKELLVA